MKQKITGLVVEDEDAIIQVISKKIKSLGHDYKIAKNQEEANSIVEKQTFDYVLLDLKLPVDKDDINPDSSTGFNLLQQIRTNHDKEHLPIIVMTAYEKSISCAVDVITKKGANDFVEKPFKSGELEKKIQEVLHIKQHEVILCLQELPLNRKHKDFYIEIVIYPGKGEKENPCRLGRVMLRFFYLTLNAKLQGQNWISEDTLKSELKYDNSKDPYWFSKRIDHIKGWLKKSDLTQYFEFYETQGRNDMKVRTTLLKEQISLTLRNYTKAKKETKA